MNAALVDQIRQIASDVFEEPLDSIGETSSPDTIENWDSLRHLNFLMALEQTFACEFDPDEGETIAKSIRDATAVVGGKLNR